MGEVDYITEKLDLDMADPMYRTFSKIFEVFRISEDDDEQIIERKLVECKSIAEPEVNNNEQRQKIPQMMEDDLLEDEELDDNKDKISKRKLKKLNRLSVAELKQLVARPEL